MSYPTPFRRLCAIALALVCSAGTIHAVPAFPGAEGFGAIATGGRGGAVYEVTNLNDTGAGSLRAAVNASGPRTIVFRVSGTINLRSDLRITRGDLTIAGQTAPGDGICLANYTLRIDADNVIVRFLRVRVGEGGSANNADGRDALFVRETDRVIIDHCSFSWSIDECASAYENSNFTMQWCIVSESLRESFHSKGPHGYAGIWGGNGASFHHNLIAHHDSRTPRFNGNRYQTDWIEKVDFRNNVIYNWGNNSAYGGEPRETDYAPALYNMVGNYYKAGPATHANRRDRIFEPYKIANNVSKFHIADNVTTASQATTDDNWRGVHNATPAQLEAMRMDEPFAARPITEQVAAGAYAWVLQLAGCVFPVRDSVDARIAHEALTGTATYGNGLINHAEDVGGFPELNSAAAPADSDHDGMPDAWEIAAGLDPNDAADRNGDRNGDGYTNLEEYLNSLVKHLYPAPSVAAAPGQFGVLLSWENVPANAQIEASANLSDWAPVLERVGSFGSTELDFGDPVFYRLAPAQE